MAFTLGRACAYSCSHAYSHAGRRIVSELADKTLKICDAGSGAEVAHCHFFHIGYMPAPTHQMGGILSMGRTDPLRIWDAESDVEVATLRGNSSGVEPAPTHPMGGVSSPCRLTLRSRYGIPGAVRRLPHCEGIRSLYLPAPIQPDGRRIVSGRMTKPSRYGMQRAVLRLPHCEGAFGCCRCLRLLTRWTSIVSGSQDKALKVWDAESGAEGCPHCEGAFVDCKCLCLFTRWAAYRLRVVGQYAQDLGYLWSGAKSVPS